MQAVRSALTWAAILVLILVWLPLLVVVRLFDRSPVHYATGRLFRRLGALMTKVNPAWSIMQTGTPPADPRHPYVVVSNHQSNADIPVISRLPWEMKWVAKQVMFDLPVVGWLLKLAGDIPVDRRDPQSRSEVLPRAKAILENRCSVMIFPEGTRSRDGRVRRFQDGSFRLAIEAGVPVLPLALDGTAAALPKDGWAFGEVSVRLHVFDPVPTKDLTPEDAPLLRERVRQTIIEKVAMWREQPAAAVDALQEEV